MSNSQQNTLLKDYLKYESKRSIFRKELNNIENKEYIISDIIKYAKNNNLNFGNYNNFYTIADLFFEKNDKTYASGDRYFENPQAFNDYKDFVNNSYNYVLNFASKEKSLKIFKYFYVDKKPDTFIPINKSSYNKTFKHMVDPNFYISEDKLGKKDNSLSFTTMHR